MRNVPATTLALVASLALNGLLGAYVAVSWAQPSRPALPASPQVFMLNLADRLPQADGDILRASIAKHKTALRETSGSILTLRDDVSRVLSEPEVDIAELEAVLNVGRQRRMEASEAVIAVLADALPKVSHKTRLQFVSLLKGG